MARYSRSEARAPFYELPAYIALRNRLAANLHRVRASEDLTQEEAAHRAGVTTRVFQRIENASGNTTLVTIARLCDGLGIDVSVLFAPGPTGGRRRTPRPRASTKR